MGLGPLLGAGLDDAAVLAGGLDHQLALFDRDGDGFLYVDILAGLAGFDSHVSMPVIRCGDTDKVDGLVGEDLSKVLDLADGGFVRIFRGGGEARFEVGLIDIADGGGDEVILPHGGIQVAHAHAAHADKGGLHLVIGAPGEARKEIRGQTRGGRGFKKGATIAHCVSDCIKGSRVRIAFAIVVLALDRPCPLDTSDPEPRG